MGLFSRKQKAPVLDGVHSGTPDITAAIAGQVSPHDPMIGPQGIVNPFELLPTGWGPDNDQQFQSGHTQNLPTNPSAEQGFGVGPERQWAHFPHVQLTNPYRALNVFQRNGAGDHYSDSIYRPEVVAFWQQALAAELATAATRNRQQANPVVNQPASVPFVSTVTPLSPGGY